MFFLFVDVLVWDVVGQVFVVGWFTLGVCFRWDGCGGRIR
jgi:hypothetical protein